MQKYNGQLIRQFASSITGNAASGITVTVRRQSDAGLATLYVDNNIAGATLSNPITTTSTGHFAFYAPDDVYTLTFSDSTPVQVIQLQDVAELQAQFDAAVLNAGYIPSGTFTSGATLTQANQVLSDGSSYWRWDGSFPKVVTAGSEPTPTGAGNWIVLSDFALRGDLADAESTVLIAGFQSRQLRVLDGIKNLIAIAGAGMVVNGFYAGTAEGGGKFYYDPSISKSQHNGGTIISPEAISAWNGTQADLSTLLNWAGSGTGCFVRVMSSLSDIPAVFFGCVGDDLSDNQVAIDKALQLVRTTKSNLLFTSRINQSSTVYRHSGTIVFDASDVGIIGSSTGVNLKYTGTGIGLSINAVVTSTTTRERCRLKNISMVSSTGAVAFDWTGANYCTFSDYEIAYTAANAKLHRASGNGGSGSYYNKFDGLSLFGGNDRSQIGFQFNEDSSPNFSNGPNANEFSNIKRAASLFRAFDIKSGTGNLFTNIGAESIKDAMFVLNDVMSLAQSGTSTGVTTNTLTDSTKSWSPTFGDTLNFTNNTVVIKGGIYDGVARKIVSNTATTLTLDKPWPQDIGAVNSYWIYRPRAVKNMFVNIRQEGLVSDNPDCIRIMPGALGNEFSQMDAGSLGSGKVFDDMSGDPTNKVKHGDLTIYTANLSNIGPSQSVDVFPRSGVFGGLQVGSSAVIEYIEVSCPNLNITVGAEAVITLDQGGAVVGGGVVSLVCKINDFNRYQAFISNPNKTQISTSNSAIFLNVATNATFDAAVDLSVSVAYRVS